MNETIQITGLICGVLLVLSLIIYPYILFTMYIKYKKNSEIKLLETSLTEKETEYQNKLTELEQSHLKDVELLHNDFNNNVNSIHYTDLSYETVNTIVNDTFTEIWSNKYLMNYVLKEMVVIPNMDEEIQAMTEDVYNALGANVKHNLLKYYDMEYFIKKITRQTTVTFMEYIKTHKPPSK